MCVICENFSFLNLLSRVQLFKLCDSLFLFHYYVLIAIKPIRKINCHKQTKCSYQLNLLQTFFQRLVIWQKYLTWTRIPTQFLNQDEMLTSLHSCVSDNARSSKMPEKYLRRDEHKGAVGGTNLNLVHMMPQIGKSVQLNIIAASFRKYKKCKSFHF